VNPACVACCRSATMFFCHCNTLQQTATNCTTLKQSLWTPHVWRAAGRWIYLDRNTLQQTVTHCAILHHTTTHCITLHHTDTIALNPACLARCRSATTLSKWRILTAKYCNTLHHTTTHCKTLLRTAKHCNTLQHTTGRRLYSESGAFSLPHTASRCNTLQRTAIHCNNLQHTATHRSATTFSKWRRWTLVHFRLLRSEISSWVPLEATWCIYIYI